VHDSADARVAARASDLRRARQRLSNLAMRTAGDEPTRRQLERLATARAERDAAERALADVSTDFRGDRDARQAGLDAVRSALPERTGLVAFACYADVLDGSRTSRAYGAYVLASGAADPVWVPIGPAQRVDALTAAVVEAGRFPEAEINYARAGAALRAQVWDPLAPLLAGAERVFIVPDGALHFVNFAALPLCTPDVQPGSEMRFVIEDAPTIHYLSAERDLVREPDATQAAGGLLAIGAPDYDAEPAVDATHPIAAIDRTLQSAPLLAWRGALFGTASFRPLPESGREVEAVSRLWSSSYASAQDDPSASAVCDRAIVLTGDAATEMAFKRAAPGRRVLHLATHAFFLDDVARVASEGARGGLIAPSASTGVAELPMVPTADAMVLSGLVFAAVNRRAHAALDADDGVLTAEEITGLDLSGVEWAVLSACDTGMGEVHAGEGLFGLRRAFQLAGVRTVITSSWPIADADCRAWMEELYRQRIVAHADTARAMRATALDLLARHRAQKASLHPATWCGFTAAGDWR
jgi:CHAT domain-containing protein